MVVAALSIVAPGTAVTVVGAIGLLGGFGSFGPPGRFGPFGDPAVIALLGDLGVLGPVGGLGALRGRPSATVRDATVGGHDWSLDLLSAVDPLGAVEAIDVVVAVVALGLLITCWTGTVVAVHFVARTVARRR